MEIIELNCVVIGGGVAGLSVARELSGHINEVAVIEKNSSFGEETSSRNSEVIHAGIYYKKDSLKQTLISNGRDLLYNYLEERRIPHSRCGKYIISTKPSESEKLKIIFNNAKSCGVNDLFYDTQEFKNKYPYINVDKAIFSPSTGIIDSHQFMQSLKNDIEINKSHIIFNNEVIDINFEKNYISILVFDHNSQNKFIIKSNIVINCCGLRSVDIHKLAFGESDKIMSRYVKGDYYTYNGKEKIDNLIYPIPEKDGLGVHVTLDLNNQIKFGPSAYEIDQIDYSMKEIHKKDFIKSIQKYWESIDVNKLNASYSGIRPKLVGVDDYQIINKNLKEGRFISVLGYDSPGLTCSLGLARHIKKYILGYK